MSKGYSTREEWLIAGVKDLETKFFSKKGRRLPPKILVSCGIPKGSSAAIGQCWDPVVTSDGTTHIFICPSQSAPIFILGILLHELVHACVGVHNGHNDIFLRVARAVGLEGKAAHAIPMEGSKTWEMLRDLSEYLGTYPHSPMNKSPVKLKNPRPKRIKLVSPTEPAYAFSLPEDVIEEHGLPFDPWSQRMILKEKSRA